MASSVPHAVQSCHELLVWLIPQLDKFPRSRRFTLGERIEGGLIEVLELLIEAAYSRNKETPLRRANLRLAVVRHLWRLAFELKVIATRSYEHGANHIDDLGGKSAVGCAVGRSLKRRHEKARWYLVNAG